MHLLIGNKLYSSWSMRPWLMLKAIGAPFTETTIPLRQPGSSERILETNPAGKVPVLQDGQTLVWESLGIIEYLADKFPHGGVWPADRIARAHARCISNEMHAGFQPLRAACPMHLGMTFAFKTYAPEVTAAVARVETLWREARTRFGITADGVAGGPYLYGHFSGADAMYAPVVSRLDGFSWPVAKDTRAYMDAVIAHPAYALWRSDALLEPRAWDIAEYEANQTALQDHRAR